VAHELVTNLKTLLWRGVDRQMLGTKMRALIRHANPRGIDAVLHQQFAYARPILDAGLVPILEPEVDIHSEQKAEAEVPLRRGIVDRLDAVPAGRQVMLQLSIPPGLTSTPA
jgi:fructose-bisphosphate aldolase class I